MKPAALLFATLPALVAGCAAPGGFPSLSPRPAEIDRVIAAPGAGAAPGLSAEERASVAEDRRRTEARLAAARSAIAEAERALAAALPAARGAPTGSEAWARAQMLLSRLQDARGALAGIDASLSPALLLTDSLGESDPDWRALRDLRAAIAAEDARSAAVAAAAQRSLGG